MPNFNVPGSGELASLYLTETEILDRYVGSTLWVWGGNTQGQLGTNNLVHRSSPIQTIALGTNWKSVATGGIGFSAAIKNDGTLWTWGRGDRGNLGQNSVSSRSSPGQTVSTSTNWRLVSCGYYHMGAIKDDGTLWLWGHNQYGQLGDNTFTDRSSPIQTIAGGKNWKQISCGARFTMGLKNDGTLWSWGHNQIGSLGNNSVLNRSSPVQTIAQGTTWEYISAGRSHAAGIKTDGTLWLWGSNDRGQLGDGTTTNRSSPVQTIAGGNNWKYVSCGSLHTMAIKTDGSLWLWGSNQYGQLGDNTITHHSSPIQTIAGGKNWKNLVQGDTDTSAGIKTDGSLWIWGRGETGALGDGTVTNRSSPVQTTFSGTNWKQISTSWGDGAPYALAVTYKE